MGLTTRKAAKWAEVTVRPINMQIKSLFLLQGIMVGEPRSIITLKLVNIFGDTILSIRLRSPHT